MTFSGQLRLTKHHGAGNDFLVVLDRDDTVVLSDDVVRLLCDRRRGIGADGVMRARAGSGAAALTMELRNADGSVAEMSGNGIRCLVQAAVEAGWVSPGVVAVATGAGLRHVEFVRHDACHGRGRVDMGRAVLGDVLGPDDLPVEVRSGLRHARLVDMGNPHVVVIGAPVDDNAFAAAGPVLERSVPGRANVEFAWPAAGPDAFEMRVFERGVGETLACGTGSCAVAAAAHDRGLVGAVVRIDNPGGRLEVEIGADGIWLAGPTTKVADVTVDAAALCDEVQVGR